MTQKLLYLFKINEVFRIKKVLMLSLLKNLCIKKGFKDSLPYTQWI